jgi:apolipoprotein N-acyltransferase
MRVMVVQSAFPHERGGAKTVTFEQQITFHFDTTDRALSDSGRVDLVAWGETVLPAMNDEAIARSNNPELSTRLRERLIEFTRRHDVSLIFGAYALLSFPKNPRDADVRNSTYLLSPGATVMPRYDKIHLVPFGEIVPFRHSIPWMHELFFRMAAYSVSYLITPGSIENLAPFRLPAGSCVVTPICFEDVDAWLIRQMIAPRGDQQKRAELILNITNDGWFSGAQHRQHLAMAALRSIENRVWTARACNMGISAFIDSSGRVVELLPTGRIGVLVRQTEIDPRLTPYTRLGDVLAIACFLGFVPIGRLRRALRKAVA